MQIEPEITFRHVEPTTAMEELIVEGIAGLEAVYDHLVTCRIAVELPVRRHQNGNPYRVRVEMSVPGKELVVDRTPDEHAANTDPRQAIGEAFDRARSMLLDFKKQYWGEVKAHQVPDHGRVVRLFPDYGFIETPEGEEVYFHANALVKGSFAKLEEGTEVRFVQEQGNEGPQATSVRTVGKHHIAP